MQPKPVVESRSEITHWMGVTDANSAGNIHGGTIMKLADEAAARPPRSSTPGGAW